MLETGGGSKKKSGRKEMGNLVLDGDGLRFNVTQPKKGLHTVALSSIRDVEQEGNACKVRVSASERFAGWQAFAGCSQGRFPLCDHAGA